MKRNKTHGIESNIREDKYVESILDILEEELAAARSNPKLNDPDNETDSLVEDLLGYLATDSE